MFSTVIAVAAVAGSLVHAAPAPIAPRGAPKTWAWGYLEDYDVYHLRYLALDCQDKHDTTFFEDCCHPLLATESLDTRPSYCTPNATEIASASSYISSTSVYGPPKTSSVSGTATATIDWEADGYPSAAVASSTPASSAAAATTTAAQVAAAPPVEASSTTSSSTTTYQAPSTTQAPTTTQAPATTQAPQTTSQASNNGGNNGGSVQSGGYATYFYQGGNPGACGNYNSDSAHIVAIDSAWWSNFGVQSQYCGRSLTIKNNNNGKTVTATVADVCPTCVNGNSLDLSVGAFTAIASESDGMVPITWWWN